MYESTINVIRFPLACSSGTGWPKPTGSFEELLDHLQNKSQSQNTSKTSSSDVPASSTHHTASVNAPADSSSTGNSSVGAIFELVSEFLHSRVDSASHSDTSDTISVVQENGSHGDSGDDVEESQQNSQSEFVFYPGYFRALQQLVQQELAKGHDPEVTLDGPWRWHDAEGKLLPKPIPIYIEGHAERPVGSDETYWVGGPDPYTAFWLDDETTSSAETSNTGGCHASQNTLITTEQAGSNSSRVHSEGSDAAVSNDDSTATEDSTTNTQYVFYPGYFRALQQLVQQELAKGHDPEVTLDGPWRWHDAEGKLLSKPIPIYIEGHPERPVGSDETYWVGGPDPYTAFWLDEDYQSA